MDLKPRILIIIDALGYSIAERFGFQPEGLPYRARLRSVPGFSQAAMTSIFTGMNPGEHGLWMMYSFAGPDRPFRWLSALPARISEERLWLRNLITWKLRRIDGIKSYFSLYDIPREILEYLDLPARENLFMPGGGQGNRTLIDYLVENNQRVFVRDYHTPEKESFEELLREIKKDSADFYILYTASLDSDLHRYGTGNQIIGERLKWYSRKIGEIASAKPNAEITVLGDHGMCDVTGSIDLSERVGNLGFKIPGDYIPFYDSTMARFRVFSPEAEREIVSELSKVESGRLLSEEERKELGISFDSGIFGDLVFVMETGKIILPSFMSSSMTAGMHGYHPDSPCMYSCLLSNIDTDALGLSITGVAEFVLPGFESGGKG